MQIGMLLRVDKLGVNQGSAQRCKFFPRASFSISSFIKIFFYVPFLPTAVNCEVVMKQLWMPLLAMQAVVFSLSGGGMWGDDEKDLKCLPRDELLAIEETTRQKEALGETVVDLSKYAKKIYSRGGEDGVIEKIFDLLEEENEFFVEIGVAKEGREGNALHLKRNRGWEGVILDPETSLPCEGIHCEQITPDNVISLFEKYQVPREFGLLSIEVEGPHDELWSSITTRYQPDVVIVPFTPEKRIDLIVETSGEAFSKVVSSTSGKGEDSALDLSKKTSVNGGKRVELLVESASEFPPVRKRVEMVAKGGSARSKKRSEKKVELPQELPSRMDLLSDCLDCIEKSVDLGKASGYSLVMAEGDSMNLVFARTELLREKKVRVKGENQIPVLLRSIRTSHLDLMMSPFLFAGFKPVKHGRKR